jgi:hypothetical protein
LIGGLAGWFRSPCFGFQLEWIHSWFISRYTGGFYAI